MRWEEYKDRAPLSFLTHNFWLSIGNLFENRWWTLWTMSLSHNQFWHILINMTTFFSMGTLLITQTGPGAFLSLVFWSALATSVASLSWTRYVAPLLGKPRTLPDGTETAMLHSSHGFSGA